MAGHQPRVFEAMRDDIGRTLTPSTMAEARDLLRAAADAAGVTISPDAAAVLLAQLAFENGRGERVIQHNWGNLIATKDWAGDFWRPPWFADPGPDTSEQNRKRHEKMLKGEAPSAFRGYSSHPEGMKCYLETVRNLGLLEAAEQGPRAYATKAVQRFCPDCDPANLIAALEQITPEMRQLLSTAPNVPEPETSNKDGSLLGLVVVGGILAALLTYDPRRS